MKRDARLRGLSSEHHQALVLARTLATRHPTWTVADGVALHTRFRDELEPHFRIEEELLLPALQSLGEADLVRRVQTDHALLRACARAASAGDGAAARALGEHLRDHIRFEERELFPVCEAQIPGAVLDEVARRTSGVRAPGE